MEGAVENYEKFEDLHVSPLHGKHLSEEVRPLIASVVNMDDIDSFTSQKMREIIAEGVDVEFARYNSNHEKNNLVFLDNGKEHLVIISGIDDNSKFSKRFYNCTGVIGVGIDSLTGENVSFLSHQDPNYFLKSETDGDKFMHKISDKFTELKQRSVPQSVDIVIFGGRSVLDQPEDNADYHQVIDLLADEVVQTFGFQPVVFQPKSDKRGATAVYLDTQARRMYLLQREDEHRSGSAFNAQDLSDKEQEWGTV
ncbi:hypothetical protein KC851_02375 [Candidatus Kaiserbacteria bacterium]|nr:hypothetical protein [Candidatus Kaiserbacteria bacterium]